MDSGTLGSRVSRPQLVREGSDTLTRTHAHRHHWWYIWIPIVTSMVWFGMVLTMIIVWSAQGHPHYVNMGPTQSIAFISDVGADILKPLFIVGCTITAIGFFASLSIERWLRHEGRLHPHLRKRERVMSILSIFWSFIGGIGLFFLSIFDAKRHEKAHRGFLLIFVVGTALSAIFTIMEYWWLSETYGETYRALKIAYFVKLFFVVVLIALTIAFASMINAPTRQNADAVIEWVIAFLFTFYLLTFLWDLAPSRKYPKGALLRVKDAEVTEMREGP